MVYTVDAGLKTVDDNNYVYWLDRKYGDKIYRKCEIIECKARLHTVLENGNISVTMITKLS